MVNFPKQRKAHCKGCKAHTLHGITWQKKAGKASLVAQGMLFFFKKSKTKNCPLLLFLFDSILIFICYTIH